MEGIADIFVTGYLIGVAGALLAIGVYCLFFLWFGEDE